MLLSYALSIYESPLTRSSRTKLVFRLGKALLEIFTKVCPLISMSLSNSLGSLLSPADMNTSNAFAFEIVSSKSSYGWMPASNWK